MTVLIVLLVGCSSTYTSNTDFGPNPRPPGWVKPTFIGIQMQKTEADVNEAECVMGTTAAGAGIVAAVATAPVSTTAWFIFSGVLGVQAGTGLGAQLGDCYNQYKAYKTTFDLYTQCPVNGPVMESTFDNYGQVTAFVNLYSCSCSLSCQLGFQNPAPNQDDYAPGVNFANVLLPYDTQYFHDGANRVNGPVQANPPPPDFNAIAGSMGLEYDGCLNMGLANSTRC